MSLMDNHSHVNNNILQLLNMTWQTHKHCIQLMIVKLWLRDSKNWYLVCIPGDY